MSKSVRSVFVRSVCSSFLEQSQQNTCQIFRKHRQILRDFLWSTCIIFSLIWIRVGEKIGAVGILFFWKTIPQARLFCSNFELLRFASGWLQHPNGIFYEDGNFWQLKCPRGVKAEKCYVPGKLLRVHSIWWKNHRILSVTRRAIFYKSVPVMHIPKHLHAWHFGQNFCCFRSDGALFCQLRSCLSWFSFWWSRGKVVHCHLDGAKSELKHKPVGLHR